ncbi:hypothetical protein K501DRAFT_239691 [Backusella circina FSU 941]|nr:hypothetical protein K501DRAFT_239691 [Backusella circina FSU 941]
MEKSLLEYDKNLEDLERQREKLEIVMQRMGQEWEESGAGVGWLGSLDLPATSQEIEIPASPILSMTDIHENLPVNAIASPLFSNILSTNSGPSPEYLQSLLNVNEALLAQSLANTTPMLTPIDERLDEPMLIRDNESNKITSLLITPQDTPDLKETFSDQQDYISNVEPESEVIFSPLTENKKISNSNSINSNNNNNGQGPIQL